MFRYDYAPSQRKITQSSRVSNKRFIRGITLVNVLISLVLSSFILAALLQWYLSIKKTWIVQTEWKYTRDKNRNFFQYIKNDLLGSGYLGCRSCDHHFPINHIYSDYFPGVKYIQFDKNVFSFYASPGACYGKMPVSSCERIKENSSVLIVYNVPKSVTVLKNPLETLKSALEIQDPGFIRKNSLVLVSDCVQADLFIANEIKDGIISHDALITINKTSAFSKAYDRGAEVVELQTLAYYIGTPERFKKHNKNPLNKPHYALFRDDFLHEAVEIISEVQKLDFQFEIFDRLTEKIKFYDTERMSKWSDVRGLKIKMTLENGEMLEHEFALRNRMGIDYNACFSFYRFVFNNTYGKRKHLAKNNRQKHRG